MCPSLEQEEGWWRRTVRKLSRAALWIVIGLLFLSPATLLIRGAAAGAVPQVSNPTKGKKQKKRKIKRKEKILKGHHGKHKGRPA